MMDDVIINAPQFADTGNTRMPHGFAHTTYSIVNALFANTRQDQVDIHLGSMCIESDIFTVSPMSVLPLSLRDL